MTTAMDVWIEFRRGTYKLSSSVKGMIDKMHKEPSGVRYLNMGLWMYGMGARGLCELLHNSYYEQQYDMFAYLMDLKVPHDIITLRTNSEFVRFNALLPPNDPGARTRLAAYHERIVSLIERLAGLPYSVDSLDKVRRLEDLLIPAVEE